MATSAFKSTTERASIGGSTPHRSLRRSRSLSRFSRPIAPEPEAEMDYIKNVPRGKFVNTTRGSTAPFPEISLDDLALEFFSSSSKNESDGGAVEREGRSASRRGEIGRWASDTASSRRRGRSVSRGRGEAVSSSSAASGSKNAVSSDASSRRRRSVSVARSRGDAVPATDKGAVAADAGTRRRRSLSVARTSGNAVPSGDKDAVAADAGMRRRSMSVARYQISDSESDIDRSRNSSNRATMVAPTGGNSHLPLASKATASSYRRLGRSRSQIDLSLIHDGYSSQSSALTDDESKDTHFGKNGFEKIIRAVHAQKKADHPSAEVANSGLYDAMRKELRHAVEEIRTELNQAMGRNQTALANDCSLSENSKTLQDSFRIREKYAQKLEQLEKRKKNLLTEMLLEEQCGREVSAETYEELPNSRASAVTEKPPQARKRSSDRSRMSERLIEDAERYFEDFISNIEDTDLSSFDGERSDESSTLGGMVKGRDFTIGEAETCRTPAGSTSRPAEMDGVILPWLQWETSHDGSPCGKTKVQTPTTPQALQRDSEKDSSQLHDASSYSMSSHGSWSPGLFHSSPMDKREEDSSNSFLPFADVKHSRMRAIFINRVLKLPLERKPFFLCNTSKRLSSLNDGRFGMDVNEGANNEGKWRAPHSNGGDAHMRKHELLRRGIENVCQILESGPWGPSLEKALSLCDDKPEADLVIGVLRRLKDINLAINYFKWVEKATNQVNLPETYHSLLILMARCRKFDRIGHVLEEMSLAGFGLSFETSVELVSSCVKAQRLWEAYDLIQTMRNFKFRPAFSAYTTLIGALAAVHKPEHPNLMLSLFHQMQELGYEVSVHLFTTLIRVFARDGQVDAALSLLDEMKSNSFQADIVLYNVCIDCFGKAGKVDMAWKFFHEIKAHGLVPDDVSFTSMIGVLCKANRMNEAVDLFEQMELNRSVPCAYAYNTMIMGYGSAGKFDEVYSLLERQRLKGSIPSVIAYNSLLTCLGRRGKVDEALKVYSDMRTDAMPNLSTYNILVDMLCRAGKLDAALAIQNDMKASGLTPDIMTVNIMIDRLCKANKLDAACSVFHSMDRKVCTPNKYTFCSLIDGLGRHGRVDDAYKLYEEMLDSNEVPDAIIYTSLIKNFFKSGRKEDGHKIYKEMVRKGASPDLTLLNTYMDCVFKAGETEKGRALFEEIKVRFTPDARSYSILINGLIKAGFARETYEIFYAMKEQGCALDTLAYNTVIDGFCKSGKVNKAYQLLEEMKAKGHPPTVVTYGSVIDGLAKIDRLDESYMLFEEAKSVGVELNVVVYSSLVDGFGKVGRIDEAYLIIEEMMQNNLTPNIQTWNCLLDALVKAEEIDEALVCWNSIKDLKCTPNIITYSILINGLCKVRKFNKAFVFWQEMQKQGLKPNAFTYLTMISGLSKAGNILEATKLYERFKDNGGIPDSACYNTMIEGLSLTNKAMEAYQLFEETRLKGCKIHTKTCVVLLDALHKAECLEQAAIVGAVLRETAKSQHASRSL